MALPFTAQKADAPVATSAPELGRYTNETVGVVRAVLEWTLVLLATPVLSFPSAYPKLTIGALALVGSVIAFLTLFDRHAPPLWKLAGRFRLPLAVLAIMALTGAVVSPTPALALPKLCGVILGMLVFRAVLLTATTVSRTRMLAWLYMLAGFSMVLGGLVVNPRWAYDHEARYAILRMMNVIDGLPGAEGGVNVNALAGSTLLFLPLFAVLLLRAVFMMARAKTRDRLVAAFQGVCYTIAVAVLSLVLLLSHSYTAWISAGAAGALLIAMRFRAASLSWIAGATVGLFAWLWFGGGDFSPLTMPGGRLEIWSVAVRDIEAHPIVGVGLGAFHPVVVSMRDGLTGQTVPWGDIPTPYAVSHAHNIFLQVALDVGIPGLVAYIALLTLATQVTNRILNREGDGETKAVVTGLWISLAAIHVFGLTDAIALGAKVGVFLWWNLALIAAIHNVALRRWSREGIPGQPRRVLA